MVKNGAPNSHFTLFLHSLGQIGRHSPDHAKHLSDQSVLPKLYKTFVDASVHGEQPSNDGEAGADLELKVRERLHENAGSWVD